MMKKRRQHLKSFLAVLLIGLVPAATLFAQAQPSTATWQDYISTFVDTTSEAAAGELLPAGVSDVVGLLASAPELTQAALIVWLNRKQQEAANADDWEKVERYRAFLFCVSPAHDCSRLREIQAQLASPTPSATPSPEETAAPTPPQTPAPGPQTPVPPLQPPAPVPVIPAPPQTPVSPPETSVPVPETPVLPVQPTVPATQPTATQPTVPQPTATQPTAPQPVTQVYVGTADPNPISNSFPGTKGFNDPTEQSFVPLTFTFPPSPTLNQFVASMDIVLSGRPSGALLYCGEGGGGSFPRQVLSPGLQGVSSTPTRVSVAIDDPDLKTAIQLGHLYCAIGPASTVSSVSLTVQPVQ
jgi:hypothetical protein